MLTKIKPYFYLCFVGIKECLIYTKALYFSLLLEIFFLLGYFCLWRAVFDSKVQVSDYSFYSFFSYLIIARILFKAFSGGSFGFFSERVHSGAIFLDISLPVNIFIKLFAHFCGRKLCNLFLLSPLFLFFFVINFCLSEGQMSQFYLWLLYLPIAFLLFFLIEFIFSLTAFTFVGQQGIHEFKFLLISLLGGIYFPLDILPTALSKVLYGLPFTYMVYFPASIYTQNLEIKDLYSGVCIAFFWFFLLTTISIVLLRKLVHNTDRLGA